MGHENTVTVQDDIGMYYVCPTSGKYALEHTSSYVNCIAEFDNEVEANLWAEEWSEASNSKERRTQLLGIHEATYPQYYRLSGKMLNEYIDYYHDEAEKEK